mgnify:CR=1 FL=1
MMREEFDNTSSCARRQETCGPRRSRGQKSVMGAQCFKPQNLLARRASFDVAQGGGEFQSRRAWTAFRRLAHHQNALGEGIRRRTGARRFSLACASG